MGVRKLQFIRLFVLLEFFVDVFQILLFDAVGDESKKHSAAHSDDNAADKENTESSDIRFSSSESVKTDHHGTQFTQQTKETTNCNMV